MRVESICEFYWRFRVHEKYGAVRGRSAHVGKNGFGSNHCRLLADTPPDHLITLTMVFLPGRGRVSVQSTGLNSLGTGRRAILKVQRLEGIHTGTELASLVTDHVDGVLGELLVGWVIG